MNPTNWQNRVIQEVKLFVEGAIMFLGIGTGMLLFGGTLVVLCELCAPGTITNRKPASSATPAVGDPGIYTGKVPPPSGGMQPVPAPGPIDPRFAPSQASPR